MVRSNTITRRRVLQTGAVTTAALSLPFVHGAHAAGKLNVAFWDHWVPGANDAMRKLCQEWADKEKVDIKVDFVTSQGDKLMLTIAAEAQAKSGHDMLTMPNWYARGADRQSRTRRRRDGGADRPIRRDQRRRRSISASRRAIGSRRRRSPTR